MLLTVAAMNDLRRHRQECTAALNHVQAVPDVSVDEGRHRQRAPRQWVGRRIARKVPAADLRTRVTWPRGFIFEVLCSLPTATAGGAECPSVIRNE